MTRMDALRPIEIFGISVTVAKREDAEAIVQKLRSLQELARYAEEMPSLLTRLEESERRFHEVRRVLTASEALIAEAKRQSTNALELEAPKKTTQGVKHA